MEYCKKMYDRDDTVIDLSSAKYEELFTQMGQPDDKNASWMRRFDLIQLAEKHVPAKMGTTFAKVVKSCLSLGESPHATLEGEVNRDDSDYSAPKVQSIKFIREILFQLRSLRFSTVTSESAST